MAGNFKAVEQPAVRTLSQRGEHNALQIDIHQPRLIWILAHQGTRGPGTTIRSARRLRITACRPPLGPLRDHGVALRG
jgi:hypothetical protein